MKKMAAVVAASAVLAAGCSAPHAEQPGVPFTPDATWSSEMPELSLNQPELPAAIGRLASAVVKIETPTRYGSGTIIENGLVVSAAHVAQSSAKRCADIHIVYQSSGAVKAGVTPTKRQSAAQKPAHGDAIVMIPSRPFRESMPSVSLSKNTDVAVGDTIFIAGYGSRQKHNLDPLAAKNEYTKPVLMPGVVLAKIDNRLDYLTLQGYGPITDSGVVPGDSGGATLTANGEYLGPVIGGSVDKMRGTDIEKNYGVDLPPEAESTLHQIAGTTIVDQHALQAMTTQAIAAATCK